MYFEVSSKLKMSKIFILSFSSQIWSAKFFAGFSFWQLSSRQCRHAATQYSPFFYMYNSLSKEFLKKVCICNVQTWANQLVQRLFLYIRDDATNYGGASPTLKDQRGLLPETSEPLLVDILNKSVAGQHFQKEKVIQFWSHPLSLLFLYIWNTSSYPVILHE